MYLYRATGDPFLLQVGEDILRSIQHSARTSCGYATIKNVRDHSTEDRMESFFLAETTKYLYLLFDPDNALNNDGGHGTVIDTPNGQCLIGAGGYVFNTEAHPIDMGALRCCHDDQRNPLAGYQADRLRGEVFDWMAAAADVEAEQTTQRRATEAETQLNANAAAEPPEEWRRRGLVTSATVDLDARPRQAADVEAARRKIVADISSALQQSRANGGTDGILESGGDDGRGQQPNGVGDDSLIVTAGEGGENETMAKGEDGLQGNDVGIADDDDLIHVDDDDDDDDENVDEADTERVEFPLFGGSSSVADEDEDVDVVPVAVVKLSSRDADDNRSSIPATTNQVIDEMPTITTGNESVDSLTDTDNVIDEDPGYVVFDDSATGSADDASRSNVEQPDADARSHFDQQRYIEDEAGSANASQMGAAMISDFVQSVLRAKLPATATFNADELLERIRRLDAGRTNVTQDFRLLTCRAQPFLQRLSVMGEFF